MDPNLWRAAESCNWEAIAAFPAHLYNQRAANGNTVLHVMVQSPERGTDAVKQILATRPDLAFERNRQLETPLILAARRGFPDVARAIIDSAKKTTKDDRRLGQVLGATDLYKNTALHAAVRNNHHGVVAELLLEELLPSSSYEGNCSGESPLYLAVERGNVEIAELILRTCKSPCHDGPEGKTSLHAAAMTMSNSAECMELLLEKMHPDTIQKVDEFGWTALHYAVKFNHDVLVKLLLSTKRSLGYIAGKSDGWKTALHIAVITGNLGGVEEILLHCPDCWELSTSKRQNILHLAVENEQKQVLDFILDQPWASELINKKDVDGNTPLHLYVATKCLHGHKLVTHPCLNKNVFNKESMNPLDRISHIVADNVTERQSWIKDELAEAGISQGFRDVIAHTKDEKMKDRKMILVVATLITTVTFACGFTVPGGFGNTGMAVRSKNKAFIAFVITDFFAMSFSIVAVVLGFFWQDTVTPDSNFTVQMFIIYSMPTIVVTFFTGLYVILPNGPLSICLIIVASIYSFAIFSFLAVALGEELFGNLGLASGKRRKRINRRRMN